MYAIRSYYAADREEPEEAHREDHRGLERDRPLVQRRGPVA